MILIKCSCGCFFSIKDLNRVAGGAKLTCQNCARSFMVSGSDTYWELQQQIKSAEMEMQIVPDDTDVSVNYKI